PGGGGEFFFEATCLALASLLLRILAAIKILKGSVGVLLLLLLGMVLIGKIGDLDAVRCQGLLELRPVRVERLEIAAFESGLRLDRAVAANRNAEGDLRGVVRLNHEG